MKDLARMSEKELRRELYIARLALKRIAEAKEGHLAQTYTHIAQQALENIDGPFC